MIEPMEEEHHAEEEESILRIGNLLRYGSMSLFPIDLV